MSNVAGPDLKLLRVFLTIAECGGFSAAQARLNVSQSTISTYMNALEERLGVRLCDRGRAGFRLTEKGKEVIAAAQQLMAATSAFTERIDILRGDLSGTLTLGIIDNIITNDQLPIHRTIADFSRRARNVHLVVRVADPYGLEEGVLNGAIDLALGPFTRSLDGLEYDHIFDERQSLYVGRHHPLFDSPTSILKRDALENLAFVARTYLNGADVRRVGIAQPAAFVSNVEAQAMMILSGSFIGYLPRHYAAQWEQDNRLRAIGTDRFDYHSHFSVLSRRSASPMPAVAAFLQDLRAIRLENRSRPFSSQIVSGAITRSSGSAINSPNRHTKAAAMR